MLCDYPTPAPPPPAPCAGASGHTVCACGKDGSTLSLSCHGGNFTAVEFASVGTPQGACGNFSAGENQTINFRPSYI